MEIFIQTLAYFALLGGVALLTRSILQYFSIRDDKKATDINNYKIIQKPDGRYYRTRNGSYERSLYASTLEEAKIALEEHVEWEVDYLRRKNSKSKDKVVWAGANVK